MTGDGARRRTGHRPALVTDLWAVAAGRLSVLRRSQARNGMFVIGGVVVMGVLGFAYWIVAAHMLTKRDVGISSATVSVVSAAGVFGSFGVAYFLMRHLSSLTDRVWSVAVTRIAVVLAASATVGGTALGVLLVVTDRAYQPVLGTPTRLAVFVVLAVLQFLSIEIDGICIAERRADIFFWRSLVFGVVKLLTLGVAGGVTRATPEWVLSTVTVSLAVSMVLALWLVKRWVRPSATVRLRGQEFALRTAARELAQHWVIAIGAQLPTYALPAIVLARAGPRAAATFYVGWNIGSLLFVIAASASQTLIAEGSTNRAVGIGTLLRENVEFVLLLQVPGIVAMFFVGPLLVHLFGGAYVAGGTTVVRVVAVVALVDGITTFGVNTARVLDKLRNAVAQSMVIVAGTMVAAWLIVPHLGGVGGGIGYGIGNAAAALVFFVCLGVWAGQGLLRRPMTESRFAARSDGPERGIAGGTVAGGDVTGADAVGR